MRTLILDVGSEALRAVVAELSTDRWFTAVAHHRVVLGLYLTARRDGIIGEGRLQLTEETVRRPREALFPFGVDRTVGNVDAGLAAAADVDDLVARCTRALGSPVHLRDAAEQARMLVVATAQSLMRPGIGSVVELLHHQVRWSGEVRCRVVHGCVRLGVDDLIGSDGDPPTSRGMTSRYWSTIWIDGRPPAGCSSRARRHDGLALRAFGLLERAAQLHDRDQASCSGSPRR